jgi:hypothetical protein
VYVVFLMTARILIKVHGGQSRVAGDSQDGAESYESSIYAACAQDARILSAMERNQDPNLHMVA